MKTANQPINIKNLPTVNCTEEESQYRIDLIAELINIYEDPEDSNKEWKDAIIDVAREKGYGNIKKPSYNGTWSIEQEITEKLCNYDTRNPNGVKSYMTEEEIKEEGYTATSKHDCSCDNCFYGRTKLALYILKLRNVMPMGVILPD